MHDAASLRRIADEDVTVFDSNSRAKTARMVIAVSQTGDLHGCSLAVSPSSMTRPASRSWRSIVTTRAAHRASLDDIFKETYR